MNSLLRIACFLAASPAVAGPCGPRDEIVATLGGKFGEASVGRGIDQTGYIMEMFVNPEQGTWSLLRTSPSLLTCVIVVGTDYDATAAPLGDPT